MTTTRIAFSLFDPALLRPAIADAFVKLDPRVQWRNPVMFVVYVGSILTTVLGVQALGGTGEAPAGFILAVAAWLWFTVLFANFAEALAEGRSKAQTASLRGMRRRIVAKVLNTPKHGSAWHPQEAEELKKGAVVLVEAGDTIPLDGEVIEGVATVDESAITGESAPVIREAGGDFASVTGGTRVLSDWLVVRVSVNSGESFLDRMIAMVEGARRQKTPNEIALNILLVALTIVFLVVVVTLLPMSKTFWRMPLLVWANFSTSTLVVLATPFIAGSQFFVMFDRVMHMSFFEPEGGGYVLGYQHIFWFYSHPAVYIMMLPGFGIVSEIVAVMSRKPIFGYRLMALSLLAILVLGFSVWAHHMFVAGMAEWLRVPMMVTTLLIAVPTGIKIFSWCATIWGGKIHFTTPMLFAVGFIAMFTIGGLSGIYLGSVPIDIHASDTYFIVAHIHYVLFGGSMLTVFAGAYYWFPKMSGRMYNEKLGQLHFWLTFIAFNVTFFPQHYIGLQGMPRRVADYADRFADFNLVISIASFGLGASTLIFVYNMIWSWKYGPPAGPNPWHALTLEWQVSSPPPIFNFDEIPQVVGGPYEYGVPGARHAIFGAAKPEPVITE